jgi:hypothetical protein
MSRRLFTPLNWLTIDYSPHPAERSFLERAQTLREREVETTVAAHGRSVLYRRPASGRRALPHADGPLAPVLVVCSNFEVRRG